MSQKITSIPTSLFSSDDGNIWKTGKADLMDKWYDDVVLRPKLPEHNVSKTLYIRDAMCAVQGLGPSQQGRFEDFGHTYKDGTKVYLKLADTIVEVFEWYDNNESVKE